MITDEIIGDDMQPVVMSMGSGDEIRAEARAMTYMTDGIEMDRSRSVRPQTTTASWSAESRRRCSAARGLDEQVNLAASNRTDAAHVVPALAQSHRAGP